MILSVNMTRVRSDGFRPTAVNMVENLLLLIAAALTLMGSPGSATLSGAALGTPYAMRALYIHLRQSAGGVRGGVGTPIRMGAITGGMRRESTNWPMGGGDILARNSTSLYVRGVELDLT